MVLPSIISLAQAPDNSRINIIYLHRIATTLSTGARTFP
jgi:hypothetical protein